MSIYDNPAFKDPQVQMQFVLLMLESVVALWVVNDARTRGIKATQAFLWGLGTLMLFPLLLPLWFLMRPKTKSGATNSSELFPREPIPNLQENAVDATSSTRSKICDHCGKFYVGQYAHCPHCGAPISTN